jgi:hypothetical protein
VFRVGKNLGIRHLHLCTLRHVHAAPLRIVGDLVETIGLTASACSRVLPQGDLSDEHLGCERENRQYLGVHVLPYETGENRRACLLDR